MTPQDKLVDTLTKRCDALETELAQIKQAKEALNDQLRHVNLHYTGACALLARTSVMLGNWGEEHPDDMRDSIEQALNDLCDYNTNLTYKRTLNRMEVLVVQKQTG